MLIGIGASPGIAIGPAYVISGSCLVPMERVISAEEVEDEIAHFHRALELARMQLREVRERVHDQTLAEHLYIIDTHLLILEDDMLIGGTVKVIREQQVNAEGALRRTLQQFRAIFDSIEDEYLRERRSDIDFVGNRLLRNLAGVTQHTLQQVDRPAVVVAHDLSPADTLLIDRQLVTGFITDAGGRTSHTAILARSLGIPAVVGLESATLLVPTDAPVIVDGSAGVVIVNPSEATFREYLQKKQAYDYHERELLSFRDLPPETLDGHRLTLRVNLELADDVPQALANRAEGVGLFRTEFLYMNRSVPPGEEEQLAIYREIVERMAPHPVTIRTLDVGGDKLVSEINLSGEANPALGLRAIRFSLKEVRLFQTQLRAILRASAYGKVRLMLPMISGVAEVRASRDHLEQVKAELRQEGLSFDPALPMGIMIETPSAVFIAELLARECDFFSVGTNDLIQYSLAVDRGNEHVAYLYNQLHPAILRALGQICVAGRKAGIPVGMCGEMAADPLCVVLLLALGFNELSMTAVEIPRVKRILRQMLHADGVRLLEQLLQLPTAREITDCLETEMTRRFPELFPRSSI